MITIYSKGTQINLPTSENSYHEVSVGAIPKLVVETTSDKILTIPLGVHCSFRGEKFYLFTAPEVVKQSSREYRYTITFYGEAQSLSTRKFKFLVEKPSDTRLKFSLSGTPRFFLEQIIRNMGEGWKIGACIEAPAQSLSFNHEDCLSVLSRLAEAFRTEWYVQGKTLNLGKVEGDQKSAIPLSYGKGRGILPGMSVESDGEHIPVGKLYIQGGERNIDPSSYGSRTLHLPKGARVTFEGRMYVADAKGESIAIEGVSMDGRREDSFDGTSVYPHRVGVVSKVERTKAGHYDIFDKDCNVDYSKYRIAGEKATITFQTGRLAGRSFDLSQDADTLKYDHATKRFQLVSIEEDGLTLPEPTTFYPAVGDKYAVFGVRLPSEYIATAEEELMKSAVRYLHEELRPKVTYKAELDGIYAQKNWGSIGSKLNLGQFVHLTDTSLGVDDKVRITGIRTSLSKEYKPRITLSNNVQAPSFASTIGKLESEEVKRSEEIREVRRESSRSLSQATAVTGGLIEALKDRFTDGISPLIVKTMQLLVGDPSLQFLFVKSPSSSEVVSLELSYDDGRELLSVGAVFLRHMTLGIKSVSSIHALSEYRVWKLAKYEYSVRKDIKNIYLYACCEESTDVGYFEAREQVVSNMQDGGMYYFLVGILAPLPDRSFTRLYGFTEILPGQIRTDKISTPDGMAYFDLQSGVIASKSIRFVYPDGSLREYPNDYLHKSIREGSTEIQGGLVLGSIIGAKDNTGAVVSYLSGTASLPAFACGVTGFGTSSYKAITELRHNGTGHIGAMHIEQGGEVVTFRPEGRGYTTVRIGGGQAKLEDLKNRSEQDSRGSVQIPRQDHNLTDKEGRKTVTLVSTAVRVLNAGSTMTLSLPVSVDAYSATNWYAEVNSKVEISVKMESSRGDVAYSKFIGLSFTEEIDYKNPGKPGKQWNATLEKTLEDEIVGLQDDIYTLKVEAYMSVDYIKDDFHPDEYASMRLSANPTTGEYRIKGVNSSAREVVFSQQGMSAFFGKTRFFYLQGQATGADDTFLTVRGKTDMPGVLLGGRVEPRSVSFEHTWGAKRDSLRVDRIGRGLYKIYHAIGHKQYTVVCNAAGNGGHNASYVEIEANYFTIRTNHDDGTYDDVWFSFVVIGENYV
ncbi:hypothetical protein [uncultured Porphyromonas sp.]|uniref:phage tail protein n=1 Tax=uncultured Porphyromonas sp. TaxID=159274 RepID=UPI00261D00D4|nr:hypothetical protein [uncultured Porphyromonas sp.]